MGKIINPKTGFPGFFVCDNHTRLKILLENDPKTLCRSCFRRIMDHLPLWLGVTMNEVLACENIGMQNSDMIQKLINQVELLERQVESVRKVKDFQQKQINELKTEKTEDEK